MPRDLIVFGEDWGGLPSSTQHIVRHLSEDRKVLWINSIGLRRPKCSLQDFNRALRKVTHKLSPRNTPSKSKESPPKNIRVLRPITLPAPNFQWERFCAAYLLEKQIKTALLDFKLSDPLLWISLPTAVDLVGRLGESAVVYYCGDDFSNLAGVDHGTVYQHEQKLISCSDLIIAASQRLADSFPQRKTTTLTHGVDFDLFALQATPATDLPNNGRPTAGFYGSLSEWLYIELLEEVIKKLPGWNFVFIGNEAVNTSSLKRFDNTYFLGPKAHAELPRYCQHWQVSLLPFRDNPQIRACNPLKLVEYLATGAPIVSTDFPALQPYRHLVQTANTAESFVEAINLSTQLKFLKSFPQALRSSVSQNTWQAKSAMVSNWLEVL